MESSALGAETGEDKAVLGGCGSSSNFLSGGSILIAGLFIFTISVISKPGGVNDSGGKITIFIKIKNAVV